MIFQGIYSYMLTGKSIHFKESISLMRITSHTVKKQQIALVVWTTTSGLTTVYLWKINEIKGQESKPF